MKSKIFIIVLLLATITANAQTKDISGIWEGKLNVGVELRLVFHFTKMMMELTKAQWIALIRMQKIFRAVK